MPRCWQGWRGELFDRISCANHAGTPVQKKQAAGHASCAGDDLETEHAQRPGTTFPLSMVRSYDQSVRPVPFL